VPWKLPEDDDALLSLAKGYPYPAPDGSYLFVEGEARPIERGAVEPALFRGRTPVLGHGSNRSPQQLARKFGTTARIPVSRSWLADYDVVYSAHMTRYGAIAANLRHDPGTSVEVWVAWLDAEQLAFMHRTELGAEIYRYGRLTDVELALEAGPAEEIEWAGVYLSTYGYLTRDAAAIPLAAVAARARNAAALHQEQVLALVRDRHRPGRDLEELLLAKIRDPARRRTLIDEMRARALPPHAPHFDPIDVLEGS
jgi:hypothetical protein